MSDLYAVVRERGPAWDTALPLREQALWDEHAAFMDGLVEDGFVVMGGPLGDGERVLLVVRADDDGAVHRRLMGDPWSKRSLLITATIDPWTILLDGRENAETA
jgi:uncharacterized protein